MLLCSAACVLLSPRALVPSCSHVLVLSCSGVAMPSRYCAPARSYRKSLITLRFIIPMVSCLICSESVAALSSILRESIRSLSNSLPVLARTGVENRAPVVAGSLFFESKGSPKQSLQDHPRSPQGGSRRPSRDRKTRKSIAKGHTDVPSAH